MTDSTGMNPSLADLLEAGTTETEPFDWDPSALADWPNIAPDAPATIFTVEPQAGGACRAD